MLVKCINITVHTMKSLSQDDLEYKGAQIISFSNHTKHHPITALYILVVNRKEKFKAQLSLDKSCDVILKNFVNIFNIKQPNITLLFKNSFYVCIYVCKKCVLLVSKEVSLLKHIECHFTALPILNICTYLTTPSIHP